MNNARTPQARRPLHLVLAALALTGSVALADHEWAYRGTMDGSLTEGYYRTHTLTLQGGYTYMFGGQCDEDCYDLDLALSNSSGVVARDVAWDDEPAISVYVPTTRQYEMEVSMEECDRSPCGYEVDFYRRAGR